ncbi:MAG: glycosyltransferase [Acidimicrobiales bacterium]
MPEFTDRRPEPVPGAPDRGMRVLGAGAGAPRKGLDAFVACLSDLATRGEVPPAAWVGGSPEALAVREAGADLRRVGIDDRVQLVAEVDDLGPWWPRHGLLLHPAREDPYPLVVVEAGQRAVPVVTWDTGGAADLLRAAGLAHLVAEPGDLVGLVRRVEDLLADEAARADAGRALQRATDVLVADQQAPLVWAACTEAGP